MAHNKHDEEATPSEQPTPEHPDQARMAAAQAVVDTATSQHQALLSAGLDETDPMVLALSQTVGQYAYKAEHLARELAATTSG